VIVFANPAALEALGYERLDELRGEPSHQTIHYKRPDGTHYPVEECPMLRPRETGETITIEEDWFVRRDGTMFPVSYFSSPVELPEGRGAVVAFTNIEERYELEQARRQRDAILDSLAQPVFVADQKGLIRYVNPAAVDALGFDDASELIGKNGHWLVHYKRRDDSHFPIEECQFSRRPEPGRPGQTGEDWFVRRDGSMVPLAYTTAPVEYEDGVATVIAFSDIQERLDAEQARRDRDIAEARAAELVASEERQRAILESALDCVVSIDADGRLTYLNAAAEETFGIRAEQAIGREMAGLIIPPSLREAHRRGFARYLEGGEPRVLDRRLEITAMRSDGTEFPVELTVTLANLPGEPTFTAFIRDITKRQRAETELLAARRRVIQAADAERRRVTRDLHDGAQQDLVNVVVNLQLAEQALAADDDGGETIAAAAEAAECALEGLRELASGIHPAILTNRGLGAAIQSLAKRTRVPVEVLEVPDKRFSAETEASLYFFVSEALTNVDKHAQASRATVRIRATDAILVEVIDDGVGGADTGSEGSGLAGLGDRIAALDGLLEIESPLGGGTRLAATVPLDG
jgi:PAS domain S-box-containing protein